VIRRAGNSNPASRVLVFAATELGEYGFGDSHPFGNDRLAAFRDEMARRGLDSRVVAGPSRLATAEELERFHDPAYLRRARSLSNSGFGYLDHGDTPARKGIFEAASRVVGTALEAVEAVMHTRNRRAFLPIGGLHHGRRSAAAGFCVLNDCAVVIETLKSHYGLERIAYVDIDAHHGDGVYYDFEDDPAVILADIHQDGRTLFPGTGDANECGRGAGLGRKLNLPLEPGAGDEAFLQAFDAALAHVASFEPEFILLQAGADSIAGDPLTQLRFTPAAHCHATRTLCDLAGHYAHGRILVMGGGGYDRANIARTWTAVVETLIEA
jgi:acetoin utilization protein AcuC